MKKRIIIGIVIVVAIIVAVVANNKPEENPNGKPVVKIGVSLGMTGNLGRMGQSNKVAVSMAKETIDKMDTKNKYEFIIEDDAFDNKVLTQVMNKFINLDKVSAVITTYSKAHKISKVYGDKEKFINLGCSWGKTAGEGKYNFNGYPSLDVSVNKLAQYIESKNLKNIGMISTSSPGAVEMLDTWYEELKDSNLNLVYDEGFMLDNKDFTMIVGKMKQQDIDILFLNMYTFEMDLLFREMKVQGVDIPVTSIEHFPFVTDLSTIEGNWFISYLASSGEDFKKAYKSRSDIPMQICVPQTYNNIMILIEAFENAKSTDISDVANYIDNMEEFEGVSGTLYITETNFNQKESPMAIIKNGKVELLEE